ncbi:MAG: DUF4230 domain-containing protein [Clostridia bacterium]|nr:DUF4230 domain-containing protein [Clostridia bacterium]
MPEHHEADREDRGFATKAKRRRSLSPLQIAAIILAALAIGSGSVFATMTHISSKPTRLSFKNIGELATQAAYFTSVQDISKTRTVLGINVPFTTSKYIFSYDGTIKAGLDFEAIELVADDATKTLTVRLPEAGILSTEIDTDSLKIYDERKNVFSPLKLDNINESLAKLKQEAQASAIENGILDNAVENAKVLIRGFLSSAYDLDVWTVDFSMNEEAGEDNAQ